MTPIKELDRATTSDRTYSINIMIGCTWHLHKVPHMKPKTLRLLCVKMDMYFDCSFINISY